MRQLKLDKCFSDIFKIYPLKYINSGCRSTKKLYYYYLLLLLIHQFFLEASIFLRKISIENSQKIEL